MSVYPFNTKRKSKKTSTDPKGYATVKDFKKGDFIRLTGKKGTKNLRQFDAKNIACRAGRFQQHYS